ncbi:B domain-containing protein [Staphylococcus hyicus]|uniref:B domain-containing protein n=1 Tax=Staphylococcus hyicus TaxID=1284 RepID=UPI001F47F7B1|nr:B domain-containing protein [Staphylococcus hyicus]MCE5154290.1 B domain-containing protein [Staphylococcus hyicus]
MRKQNISRLLIGAATLTLATMVANGEAKASEHTTHQQSTHHYQTHQQHAPQQQARQNDHKDVQRAYYHLIHLKGIDEAQRGRFLKQLHDNPTKETAQNVFSESTKDVNNPERRLAQRNAYFSVVNNPNLSSADRERYIDKIIENPDHSQQTWIESNRVPSQNKDNSATEEELHKLINTQQQTQQTKQTKHANDNTLTDDLYNKLYLPTTNAGKADTTGYKATDNGHKPSVQDLKAKQEEQHVVQKAFQFLLQLKGLDEKQRSEFLKQLHENPTKETAQNVFSEASKDVTNPERRVAQRKAYINLLENNKLPIGDLERLVKELHKNPDHAQQIWIESHRLSNANTQSKVSEHEFNRLVKPTQKDFDRRDDFLKSNELKALQGSNSGNTASVDEFQRFTQDSVIDLENNKQKLDYLLSSNKDNTVSAEQFRNIHLPNISVPSEKGSLEYLTNSNRDNTLTDDQLPNIINSFPIIPVAQDATIQPRAKASHKRHAHKSSYVKERGITYPLLENSDAQNKFIEELLGPNGTKNLTLEQLEKLFPAIPVTKETMEARQNDRIASANKALVALNKDYSVNSHRFAQREVNKAPHHVQAQLQKQLDGILTTHREKAEKERLQKHETNKTSHKASTSKTDTQTKITQTKATQTKTTQSKATQTTKSEQQTTTSSYYKSLKNYFTQGYHNVAQSHQGFKAKYEQAKYYFNTYFKHKSTIDKLVLAALGNGSKTHIKPLDIKPNGNVFYNTYAHARNYATEALNTGKVLYALYQNPKTVKTAIAAADTVSSFSHSLSNFFASIMK